MFGFSEALHLPSDFLGCEIQWNISSIPSRTKQKLLLLLKTSQFFSFLLYLQRSLKDKGGDIRWFALELGFLSIQICIVQRGTFLGPHRISLHLRLSPNRQTDEQRWTDGPFAFPEQKRWKQGEKGLRRSRFGECSQCEEAKRKGSLKSCSS